jgi:cell fate regulator YaaT (PSP1 superfamily)
MLHKTLEYLVSHGKTGALERFLPTTAERFVRGDRVVLQSERGLTLGVVLCEASESQARLLGAAGPGQLLRRVSPDDEAVRRQILRREQQIFDVSRSLAAELLLPMEILDCELSLDGRRVILQYLIAGSCEPASLIERLAAQFEIEVCLENLAAPIPEEQHHGGCGEPDCGRADGGSGCTTCATGGGCSSCGTGKVDLKPYFSHLREKMDEKRTPLV